MGPESEPPAPPSTPTPGTPDDTGRDPRVRDLVPVPAERRGCNPLVFGVVMATLEMALLVGLWLRCR